MVALEGNERIGRPSKDFGVDWVKLLRSVRVNKEKNSSSRPTSMIQEVTSTLNEIMRVPNKEDISYSRNGLFAPNHSYAVTLFASGSLK